ncbi:MAG: glycoside hydrolase family 1 protein [Candidatus Omnitrophota bacterium]|jgi:beta-glucosidase
MTFPFLWGAATSSHQVEGENTLNDWWEWERAGRLKESSGLACDHYRRYGADFDLVSELGHNAHRFSIEWSRLEPVEGRWDEAAFAHYEDVLKTLRAKRIEPVVTLHHFTNPLWFARRGGWANPACVTAFARYVRRAAEAFGKYVRIWITINEPTIYVYHAHLAGLWPPGGKSLKEGAAVFRNMLFAHAEAYREIHRLYETKSWPRPWVSFSQYATRYEPCRPEFFADRWAASFRNESLNHLFVKSALEGFLFFPGFFCEFLPVRKTLDFIGLNYYMSQFVRVSGLWGAKLAGESCDEAHHAGRVRERNAMNWPVDPEGFGRLLVDFGRYGLPILVTENGICAADDEQRSRFIREHLGALARAREAGARVSGYFYWSLLDNFEWAHGFGPRFGIVEVDYATQERKVRRSAQVLSTLCRQLERHGT